MVTQQGKGKPGRWYLPQGRERSSVAGLGGDGVEWGRPPESSLGSVSACRAVCAGDRRSLQELSPAEGWGEAGREEGKLGERNVGEAEGVPRTCSEGDGDG